VSIQLNKQWNEIEWEEFFKKNFGFGIRFKNKGEKKHRQIKTSRCFFYRHQTPLNAEINPMKKGQPELLF